METAIYTRVLRTQVEKCQAAAIMDVGARALEYRDCMEEPAGAIFKSGRLKMTFTSGGKGVEKRGSSRVLATNTDASYQVGSHRYRLELLGIA